VATRSQKSRWAPSPKTCKQSRGEPSLKPLKGQPTVSMRGGVRSCAGTVVIKTPERLAHSEHERAIFCMFWGRAPSHLWGVPSRGTRQSRLAPRLNCSGLRTVGNGLANSRISQPPIIANKEGSWLTIIANGLILLCEQLANNARDQPAWQIAPTDTPCPIKRLFHIVLDTHGQDRLCWLSQKSGLADGI
jgi:hypothetical protein